MPKQKLIVILGPTASGKTSLSIKLAKKFKGEVISADSRQVYKGMDIGTGKVTKREMQGVPHHLIDVITPKKQFNVAIFKKLAEKKIKEILKRGKIPFLVGGTGLYIDAITKNIDFPKVPPNKKLRKKLEKKTKRELFNIYKKLDSRGLKFIEKDNKRRLIRAIEVCKATKQSFWKQRKGKKQAFEILEIGIKTNREKFKEKIKKRVNQMIKTGLEKETKRLSKKYGWVPLLETIGYQEWQDYFKNKIDKNTVKDLINLHAAQFAKRQMAWFKRNKEIHWIKTEKEAKRLIRDFIKK